MKLYPKDPTFLDVVNATDRQRELYHATMQAGCVKAAGRLLGIADQNIYTTLDKLVKKAADKGWTEHSDNTRFVPPGQKLVGQSTLTKDEEGNTV